MSSDYDVVIAGSGAGGGFCAMSLTQQGLKVLLIERGKRYNYKKDYPMNHPDWELKASPLASVYELFDHGNTPTISTKDHVICSGDYIDNRLEQNKPTHRKSFQYHRALGVGGSTLHYQGEAHRFPEHAFKPKTLFGWGEDWPLGYAEIEPFYKQVENILGVAGNPENPFKPKRGQFPTPAHHLSTRSQLAKLGSDKLGWSLLQNTLALPSESVDGRLPCQHSGGCYKGCIFGAKSSVDMTAIPRAESTGNLTLLENARVTEIETDAKGDISGFVYIKGGKKERAQGKRYILAMGAIETPRILLASQNGKYPNGIGNNNDNVGRNFMETISATLQCEANSNLHSYKGPPIDARIWDFAKPNGPLNSGFVLGVAGTITSRLSPLSYSWGIPGFGLEHKKQMREKFGRAIQLLGITEHIPHADNRVSITDKEDEDGVPLVHIYSDYGTEDKRTLKFMIDRIVEWADACELTQRLQLNSTYDSPAAAHVGGTCRMGNDPEKSVTNAFGQVHGIDNLFITDGSVLPTLGAGDSPSLTIQALAIRTAKFIVGS